MGRVERRFIHHGAGHVSTWGNDTVLAHGFTRECRISDFNKIDNFYYLMSNTDLRSKEDQWLFITFNSSFPHDENKFCFVF